MSRLKSIVAEGAGEACVLGGVGRGARAGATLTDAASRAPIETPARATLAFAPVWQRLQNSESFMSRDSSRSPSLHRNIRRSTLRFKGVVKIQTVAAGDYPMHEVTFALQLNTL